MMEVQTKAQVTASQRREHDRFLDIQNNYEKVYQKKFYHFLNSINWAVWKYISENGTLVGWETILDRKSFRPLYEQLYLQITLKEARRYYYNELPKLLPNDTEQKDIIDDLTRIITGGQSGNVIRIWENVLREYIGVRITDRIKHVSETTRQRIAELIKRGINLGKNPREIAGTIKTDYGYNRNRSLAIARTETISAMNQGKFMSALSSPYRMDKRWIPVMDSRTRETHALMVDNPWIPLMRMFRVPNGFGGYEFALYPCAPSLSAKNSVQCRCSITFRVSTDDNGNVIRR